MSGTEWLAFSLLSILLLEALFYFIRESLPIPLRYSSIGLILDSHEKLRYVLKQSVKSKILVNDDGNPWMVETTEIDKSGIGARTTKAILHDHKIIAIGDSFTFGNDVDITETWPFLLQQRTGLKVLNLGVPGYSVVQSKVFLEEVALKHFRCDLVLFGFFHDDISGILQKASISQVLINRMSAYSTSFRLLVLISKKISMWRRPKNEISYLSRQEMNKLIRLSMSRYAVNLAKQCILDAKELCLKKNVKFILILFPAKEQVYWKIAKNYYEGITEKHMDYPTTIARLVAEANGVEYIDMLTEIRRRGFDKKLIYSRKGPHLNGEGNKIIASILANYLASEYSQT